MYRLRSNIVYITKYFVCAIDHICEKFKIYDRKNDNIIIVGAIYTQSLGRDSICYYVDGIYYIDGVKHNRRPYYFDIRHFISRGKYHTIGCYESFLAVKGHFIKTTNDRSLYRYFATKIPHILVYIMAMRRHNRINGLAIFVPLVREIIVNYLLC